MSVSTFKLDDHPSVLDLMASFSKEADQPFSKEHFLNIWGSLEDAGMAQLFGQFSDDGKLIGALACYLTPDPMSSELTGTECFWYVYPEHRGGHGAIKLVQNYIDWAKDNGAKKVIMVHLTYLKEEKLHRLYERLGFMPVEVNYIKRFE